MSLSFEEFAQALERCHAMDERLQKLFGFNPTTCDHYGIIRLYNQRIDSRTADETIIAIRNKYLKWRKAILDIFEAQGVSPDEEDFDAMFRVSGMYGTLYFLDIPVDIDGDPEIFRQKILAFLENEKSSQNQ